MLTKFRFNLLSKLKIVNPLAVSIKLLLFPLLFTFSNLAGADTTDVKIPQALIVNYDITIIAVSPEKDYVAYVTPVEDTEVLVIAKLDTLEPLTKVKMGKNRYVGMLSWVNHERLMLWPVKAYGKEKHKFFTGEVQALNYNGKRNILLWGYQSHLARNSRIGHLTLTNRLDNDPHHIMVTTTQGYKSDRKTRTLRKINIYTGRMFIEERSTVTNAEFVVDNHGKAVMQWGSDEHSNTIVMFKNQQDQWQNLSNAQDFQKAWVADDSNVILQHKANQNHFLKFDRLTEQYSGMTRSDIEAFKLERDLHHVIKAKWARKDENYLTLAGEEPSHLRDLQSRSVSYRKIREADSYTPQSNQNN